MSAVHSSSQELWHKRLGHLGHKNMQLVKQLVDGVNFNTQKFEPCVACVEGKMCRQPFKPRPVGDHATEKLGLVHTDLCGPMNPPGLKYELYMMLFTDDYIRKTWDYYLMSKQCKAVLECFKDFITMVENQAGKKIKILRSGNGGEFTGILLKNELRANGIVHQTTIPDCAHRMEWQRKQTEQW